MQLSPRKFCAPLRGARDVARNASAFDTAERYMGLRRWRRDIRLALDIRGTAGGAAQGIARAISANQREDLSGIICIRSGFTHTVLRDVEQLFDRVGCSAGTCYEHADMPPAQNERTGGST